MHLKLPRFSHERAFDHQPYHRYIAFFVYHTSLWLPNLTNVYLSKKIASSNRWMISMKFGIDAFAQPRDTHQDKELWIETNLKRFSTLVVGNLSCQVKHLVITIKTRSFNLKTWSWSKTRRANYLTNSAIFSWKYESQFLWNSVHLVL